jgi:hypothetical protein
MVKQSIAIKTDFALSELNELIEKMKNPLDKAKAYRKIGNENKAKQCADEYQKTLGVYTLKEKLKIINEFNLDAYETVKEHLHTKIHNTYFMRQIDCDLPELIKLANITELDLKKIGSDICEAMSSQTEGIGDLISVSKLTKYFDAEKFKKWGENYYNNTLATIINQSSNAKYEYYETRVKTAIFIIDNYGLDPVLKSNLAAHVCEREVFTKHSDIKLAKKTLFDLFKDESIYENILNVAVTQKVNKDIDTKNALNKQIDELILNDEVEQAISLTKSHNLDRVFDEKSLQRYYLRCVKDELLYKLSNKSESIGNFLQNSEDYKLLTKENKFLSLSKAYISTWSSYKNKLKQEKQEFFYKLQEFNTLKELALEMNSPSRYIFVLKQQLNALIERGNYTFAESIVEKELQTKYADKINNLPELKKLKIILYLVT